MIFTTNIRVTTVSYYIALEVFLIVDPFASPTLDPFASPPTDLLSQDPIELELVDPFA